MNLLDMFKGSWVRIGIGALGVWLVMIGLVVMIASNKTVQNTVGTAAKVVATKSPIGAAIAVGADAIT